MGQFHFHPDDDLALMHAELPAYERLQEEAATATGERASRLLELGTGTGETARRVLSRHPGASLVGIDASADMLAKADLFTRVAAALEPGGRFVLADVVVPDDRADAVTPLSPDFDLPSSVDDQLAWLRAAGLEARVAWAVRDLAVIVAVRPSASAAAG